MHDKGIIEKSGCDLWVFCRETSCSAGESEILGVRDVVLKSSARYSHGLAPHASIPVYLQAVLLLLC